MKQKFLCPDWQGWHYPGILVSKGVESRKSKLKKTFITVREFSNDELIVTSTVGNAVSKSWCQVVNWNMKLFMNLILVKIIKN